MQAKTLIHSKFQLNKEQNIPVKKSGVPRVAAPDEIKNSETPQKINFAGLEKLMFMVSHKVRQPITHIMGIASLMAHAINSPKQLKILLNYLKDSAKALDTFTRELTEFVSDLMKTGSKKN